MGMIFSPIFQIRKLSRVNMFVLVACQCSNPELFDFKLALNHYASPNQRLCDFKSSVSNLPHSTLTSSGNSGKPDQLTH